MCCSNVDLHIIESQRFIIRELTEKDVTEVYLSWLTSPEAKLMISLAHPVYDLDKLKEYVMERFNSEDAHLFGVFDRISMKHIGNIKYEPIDKKNFYAIMGVLIGDRKYRGKGVFPEIYRETAKFLITEYQIKRVLLGVYHSNEIAIKSYRKAGFKETDDHALNPSCDVSIMAHDLASN